MKFASRYRIALHNINNNKSRSILTMIIVYVISLLIMTLLCLGVSYSTNMSNITKVYFQTSGEPISINYNNYNGDKDNHKRIDKDNIDTFHNILLKYENTISSSQLTLSGYDNDIYIVDSAFPLDTSSIEIVEGRNLIPSDYKKNNVVISTTYKQQYYVTSGEVLVPGSTFNYNINYSTKDTYSAETNANLEFKVVGVYNPVIHETSDNTYHNDTINNEVILDAGYLAHNANKLNFYAVSLTYIPSEVNFDSNEFYNNLNNLTKELNDQLPKSYDDNSKKYEDCVYCGAIETLKLTRILSIIIIIGIAFICLVLVLLSIGSLANTIMISVDKNKKFIGLLKALGLNENDLKSTIRMESITTIVAGILLAFLTVFLCRGFFGTINNALLDVTMSQFMEYITYTPEFLVPLYIPAIVMAFFIFFTLLFARGSMSKIAHTDPMAVISEVA